MTLREEVLNLTEGMKPSRKGFENPEKQKWIKGFVLSRTKTKDWYESFNDLLSIRLDNGRGGHNGKEEIDFWKKPESDRWCEQVRTALNKFLGQAWVDKFDKWAKEVKEITLS